jgi:hypothetical protein
MGVALEVNFHTFGDEALAAEATATAQNVATIDGLHAGAESELLLAGSLGGLVGAFGGHKIVGVKIKLRRKRPTPHEWGVQNRGLFAFVNLQVASLQTHRLETLSEAAE